MKVGRGNAEGMVDPARSPLAIAGSKPGHEIEHPMALVILGGLVTATLINLFVLPALYLRFGKSRKELRAASARAATA